MGRCEGEGTFCLAWATDVRSTSSIFSWVALKVAYREYEVKPMGKHWGTHRAKEEKLQRIRLGSRYVGLDLGQFYWKSLKLVAASEELTETDILRRVIRSWNETLPPTILEKARPETARVEAWKAQVYYAPRQDTRLRLKQARLRRASD